MTVLSTKVQFYSSHSNADGDEIQWNEMDKYQYAPKENKVIKKKKKKNMKWVSLALTVI